MSLVARARQRASAASWWPSARSARAWIQMARSRVSRLGSESSTESASRWAPRASPSPSRRSASSSRASGSSCSPVPRMMRSRRRRSRGTMSPRGFASRRSSTRPRASSPSPSSLSISGLAQGGDQGLAVAGRELRHGGGKRVARAAKVAGSTPNPAQIELRLSGPDRVRKALEEVPGQGRGLAGVVRRGGGPEPQVEREVAELRVACGLGQLRGQRETGWPGLAVDRSVRRFGFGSSPGAPGRVDCRLWPWAPRCHHQHGNPARRSAPHDGFLRVPRAPDAGNLTRAPVARTMRGVLASVEQPTTRIGAVRAEIDAAARRAGRDPASVRIIAVTKTLPPDAVVAALDGGVADIGENYVQEAERKRAAVARDASWHLIGGLQRNKVRAALQTLRLGAHGRLGGSGAGAPGCSRFARTSPGGPDPGQSRRRCRAAGCGPGGCGGACPIARWPIGAGGAGVDDDCASRWGSGSAPGPLSVRARAPRRGRPAYRG